MGSEMCIRDSSKVEEQARKKHTKSSGRKGLSPPNEKYNSTANFWPKIDNSKTLATRMIDMGGVKPQGQGRASCHPVSFGNGSNVEQQAEKKHTRR